eukprot:3476134-Pyramimonas_sp.AAC.3
MCRHSSAHCTKHCSHRPAYTQAEVALQKRPRTSGGGADAHVFESHGLEEDSQCLHSQINDWYNSSGEDQRTTMFRVVCIA